MAHDTTITIHTDEGDAPAHVLTPSEGAGPWPGVLFFIDGLGMRRAILDVAARIADAGYYVLAPDLFWRAGSYTAPDAKQLFADPTVRAAWFQKIGAVITPDKMLGDTRSYLAHLAGDERVKQPRFGIVGYCMGGRMALAAAAHYPDEIAAAAAYHPGNVVTDAPESPHRVVGRIKGRVYVGGASDDATFTDEHKRQLGEALAAGRVEHTIETYPARHGWVPSDTPVHDPAAAERHYATLLELYLRTL